MEIKLVCISAGSPYYTPHIQRPALFPPSDGYEPPEDPIVGVARLIAITGEIKARYPHLAIVGSGYSYLQEWLPKVAQYYIRTGQVDFVGLGRLVLSYHDLPGDVLAALRSTRSDSAALLAIAPPGRVTVWSPAAFPWTRSIACTHRVSFSPPPKTADGPAPE